MRAVFATPPLNRRAAWIALFAMLWLALAPTLSHALAAARGVSPWAEICTVDGPRQVGAGDAAPSSPAVHHVFDHCPFCALQPLNVPLPSAPFALPADVRTHEMPALFFSAPATQHAWRHAHSRGPPHAA
jgi:hypothetical protein